MNFQPQTLNPHWDPSWIVEQKHFDLDYLAKYETIFAQGNGYLGQRAALDESYVGQTRNLFVSGTFDRFHPSEVSELPNLPDVTNLELRVDGGALSLTAGTLEEYYRALNLKTGELYRAAQWRSPGGKGLRLQWRRVVSAAQLHLIAAQLTVTALDDVVLTITGGIDGRVSNSGTQHTVEGNARVYDGGILEYPCSTLQSGIQVVTHSRSSLTVDGSPVGGMKIKSARRYLAGTCQVELKAGQTLVLEKISSVHTGRDLEYADLSLQEANRKVLENSLEQFRLYCERPYGEIAEESAGAWRSFWQTQDIQIETENVFDKVAIRFAIYHMNIMTNHRDSRVGVGAKGLSGEGYKGHSFWDTEIFIFPFFLFTQPQVGRNLLEFRFHGLDGARKRAREQGFEGAMYPWEAGWIADGDVTPDNLGVDLVTGELLPCETGQIELHVTADIAFAVEQYYSVTGDDSFMERCGYEILLETARFWASRLEWVQERQRYEIRHIIGPDEYQVDVDNNAYTNYMAAWNLELGIRALAALKHTPEAYARLDEKLKLEGLEEMLLEKVEKLYLPKPDPETGVLPQYDGYFDLKRLDITRYRNAPRVGEIMKDFNFKMMRQYQVLKQADVVQLMYLLGDLFPGEVRRNNYLYYEPRTLHDSSLSKAVHSVMASELGMEEAYDMYVSAAKTDLGPEPDSCDQGVHSANMGGMWQAVVMGFGGLRCTPSGLRIAPRLPKQWDSLCYGVNWKGGRLTVTVTHDTVCVHNHGAELTVELADKPVTLGEGKEITVTLKGVDANGRSHI